MINPPERLDKSMNRGFPIYFKEQNKLLLPVFKCGYTSSHTAYATAGRVLRSFNDLIDYPDVEKVALIRNPYKRIVSLWTCQNNRDNLHRDSRTFEEFVLNVKELLSRGYVDGHYNTLVANLSIHGEFIPNRVFDISQIPQLVEHIGINIKFPKANESKDKKPYQKYYTDKTRELVEEIYKEDFERFGYTFE